MNTRQKLTLGIAAIFMVTLTIVGVTYAYFVTRITGDDNTDTLEVQTATVGDIVYKDINGDELVIDNALPGTTKYYQFSVANLGEEGSGTQAFELFLTSSRNTTPFEIAGTQYTPGEYIHAKVDGVDADNSNTTVQSTCYGEDKAMSASAEASTDYKGVCFAGTKYNNFKITLYELDPSTPTGVTGSTGSKTYDTPAVHTSFNPDTTALTNVVSVNADYINHDAETGLATKDGTVKNLTIAGNTVRNFVLKVEYLKSSVTVEEEGQDPVTTELVQNAENLASLKIKVNIR